MFEKVHEMKKSRTPNCRRTLAHSEDLEFIESAQRHCGGRTKNDTESVFSVKFMYAKKCARESLGVR